MLGMVIYYEEPEKKSVQDIGVGAVLGTEEDIDIAVLSTKWDHFNGDITLIACTVATPHRLVILRDDEDIELTQLGEVKINTQDLHLKGR